MTFTYDEDLISDLDKVRDLLQDVDSDYPLLSDESILQEISVYSSILLAAAACCRKLAARFALKVNFTVGRKSKSNSDLYTHFIDLAAKLEAKASQPTFDESTAEVGTVTDTTTYPEGLKHGNETEISWP
jgi:hypothetical protein